MCVCLYVCGVFVCVVYVVCVCVFVCLCVVSLVYLMLIGFPQHNRTCVYHTYMHTCVDREEERKQKEGYFEDLAHVNCGETL